MGAGGGHGGGGEGGGVAAGGTSSVNKPSSCASDGVFCVLVPVCVYV